MKRSLENLSHNPILLADYENRDNNAGDAKYISIGKASWNEVGGDKYISAKVFRLVHENEDKEHWSRQSEELPLWRVLDLAILIVAQMTGKKSRLKEYVFKEGSSDNERLRNYFIADEDDLAMRLKELKELLSE